MAALPQLLHPETYRPCDWDLLVDDRARAVWLGVFETQIHDVRDAAVRSGYAEHDADAARDAFLRTIAALRDDPRAIGDRLDILALDRARDAVLRDHGVGDPFRAIKARENDAAIALLPERLRTLDATDEARLLPELIRGVYAGNLFDMGAKATADRFSGDDRPDFDACARDVPERPWGIDDLDGARPGGRSKAVLFVDNAGADALLGMLPLARAMAQRGAEVVIGANTLPSLNDVTASELIAAIERCPALTGDEAMSRVRVLETGSTDPLIDLGNLTPAFCDAARGADLVVLEGMGRALESNWAARLSCEVWRMAIVKMTPVAERRGVGLFDCVFRRDAPAAG